MSDLLFNIFDGFVSILEIPSQGKRLYVRNDDGFARDRKHLRSDVRVVGESLREGVKKYGQQSSSSEGYKQAR